MSPKPRVWVLALAVALFVLVVFLRLVMDESEEPPTVAFAPSVALFALELGAIGGGIAGAVAVATAALTQESPVTFWSVTFRSGSLVVLGFLVGALGHRLRLARASASAASQINDDVVQSLVLAKYALDRGDVDEAQARVDETLASAKQIVEGLTPPDVRPGDLRRAS
jgi:hypothetical protein